MQKERGHPGGQPAADYGYDMAHDELDSSTPAAGAHEKVKPVYVPTETSDLDEDYSYDLAHDIPRPGAE